MNKLGLIGGIGPESTVLYYKEIVSAVQQAEGRPFFPNLTIESLNVFKILSYCSTKDYYGLIDYVGKGIANLAGAGADFAALTGNTPHLVFDELQRRSPIPLVSSVEVTCQAAVAAGMKQVALLGTIFTMEEDFFKAPFRRHGIRVVIPTAEERGFMKEAIEKELEFGIVREETQAKLGDIARRLARQEGAEAVILGCTELPLAFKDVSSPVPYLDTMRLHIAELVRQILAAESFKKTVEE